MPNVLRPHRVCAHLTTELQLHHDHDKPLEKQDYFGIEMNKSLYVPTVACCALLAACSPSRFMAQSDPGPAPDLSQIAISLKTAAVSEKIHAPLEISPPIEANPISTTPWIVCIRSGATDESKKRTYSALYNANVYVSIRLSAIVDHCEEQSFTNLN